MLASLCGLSITNVAGCTGTGGSECTPDKLDAQGGGVFWDAYRKAFPNTDEIEIELSSRVDYPVNADVTLIIYDDQNKILDMQTRSVKVQGMETMSYIADGPPYFDDYTVILETSCG